MYDYVTTEADRLNLFRLPSPRSSTALVLANHVEAVTHARRRQASDIGVSARDAMSARTLDISARLTVNATGSAVDSTAEADRSLLRRADAEGDESGHQAGCRRRSARRAFHIRALFVPRAVARACLVRHVGIGSRLRSGRPDGRREGRRVVHHRAQSSISGVGPDACGYHPGPSRESFRRSCAAECAAAPRRRRATNRFAITRPRGTRGSSASPGPSSPRREPWPNV